jgi:Protein of unknown function (DUF2505)
MRFGIEHTFDVEPATLTTVWLDPAFHLALDLPDVEPPGLVAGSVSGTEHALELRYEFVGHVDPIVTKLLAGRRLTWRQKLTFDTASGRGTLTFASEGDGERLKGSAVVTLQATDGNGTRRTMRGDLRVRVPMLGGTAERRIVPGLVRRLDVEADVLRARLTRPE